ncbi:BREX-2 system phosphatase PglZ [Actinosynnema sp. NPDC050436]|uniref:BREX-2 system phosphatase PglZ n=1 Tax=Actinosynnema sp. NPDC050436 TaxID=3155659 RepID=UPI0033F20E6D
MTPADLDSAVENAVVSRVSDIVDGLDRDPDAAGRRVVIGVRTRREPVWHGARAGEVRGRPVRYVPCPSVLSVLDALASPPDGSSGQEVLVVLTDRGERELGEAVMARFHRAHLHDVSKYTLLQDLLKVRQLDARLRGRENTWLVDALVDLARTGQLPNTTGLSFGREVALRHVVRARLSVDSTALDLTSLITAADVASNRTRWQALDPAERSGITAHLVERLGGAADVVLRLAAARDDVLAELLVADVLTGAPEDDLTAAHALGAFTHSRFGPDGPSRAAIAAAAAAAVEIATGTDSPDVWPRIRHADTLLAQLNGSAIAYVSRVLPSGFTSRLERAAKSLDDRDLAAVRAHHDAHEKSAQVRRLHAAVRLHRWWGSRPPEVTTTADALRRHARDLAWVDAELIRVRHGSSSPEVAKAFERIASRVGKRRAELDSRFAATLPEAAYTVPSDVLGVETVLPEVIAPLARRHKVLLIVVDGMSGAAAAEITWSIAENPRLGWTEVVRSADGGREAVLAAFPTETAYSRTSLLTASLSSGNADAERRAFPKHSFWPPRTRAVVVHKAGVAGTSGLDLGSDLDAEFAPRAEPQVLAVVLNTVDDALARGRQSDDPGWDYRDVAHLPALLERAAENGWVVVLTSDHGHVLEHASRHRPDSTGTARWRRPGNPVQEDEVVLTGPRVLVDGGTAVLAATEAVRYGARSHGYHGGASLAEVAIPLVVLLPPGTDELDGWAVHSQGQPDWWTGREPRKPSRPARTRREPAPAQPDLFARDESRGARLIAGETFVNTHRGQPANRVLKAEVFRDVVDAVLGAGGRLPVAEALQAAGTPGRNPRGLVAALGRVLNIDQFPVVDLIDGGRTLVINEKLLDEQFPEGR